jgi:hypothetical protein
LLFHSSSGDPPRRRHPSSGISVMYCCLVCGGEKVGIARWRNGVTRPSPIHGRLIEGRSGIVGSSAKATASNSARTVAVWASVLTHLGAPASREMTTV